MSNITAVAKQFFEACETGEGWEGCRAYCTANASFSRKPSRSPKFRLSKGTPIG
jgi:hypothetical protein